METATTEVVRFVSKDLSGRGAGRIEADLGAIDGVRDVEVVGDSATVTFDSAIVDQNAIRTALEDAGLKIADAVKVLSSGTTGTAL